MGVVRWPARGESVNQEYSVWSSCIPPGLRHYLGTLPSHTSDPAQSGMSAGQCVLGFQVYLLTRSLTFETRYHFVSQPAL